jgi:hypothetical protein
LTAVRISPYFSLLILLVIMRRKEAKTDLEEKVVREV